MLLIAMALTKLVELICRITLTRASSLYTILCFTFAREAAAVLLGYCIQTCYAQTYIYALPHVASKAIKLVTMDTQHQSFIKSVDVFVELLALCLECHAMNFGQVCQRTVINMPDLANQLIQNVIRGRHEAIAMEVKLSL